jgi:hypothetical protein
MPNTLPLGFGYLSPRAFAGVSRTGALSIPRRGAPSATLFLPQVVAQIQRDNFATACEQRWLKRVLDRGLARFEAMVDIHGPLVAVAVEIPPLAVEEGAAASRQKHGESGCQ